MARFDRANPAKGARYWTDGWDGYAPARNRLLGAVADKKVPGVAVLGGNVHANEVADLEADFDDLRSAVIATEFCGISISRDAGSAVGTAAQFAVQAGRPGAVRG